MSIYGYNLAGILTTKPDHLKYLSRDLHDNAAKFAKKNSNRWYPNRDLDYEISRVEIRK